MKKLNLLLLSSLAIFSSQAFACTDAFINKGGYHVEARTLDFLVNFAFEDRIGYIGDKNTTDVIIDADKIPATQLTSWVNKYGFIGRAAFNGERFVDGMNTQGLSVAILYLPGSKFPAYDASDKRPVVAIYDLVSYLLSQASTTAEAVELVRSHQLIGSAVRVSEGNYIKDIPIHYVVRDKKGESLVIEFIEGKVKIYENAGDVLTNAPPFDWQLKHASYYDSLLADSKTPNDKFKNAVYNYDEIYKTTTHKGEANLLGVLGDFTPPSRFARAKVLLNNFPEPSSREIAIYQANTLINSISVPALKGAEPTLWASIKDLDNGVYYTKNILFYQGDNKLSSVSITNGYTPFDLKSFDFSAPGASAMKLVIQPTDPKAIKKIIPAETLAEFNQEN
ncbi:MAG: linear amide C-N hydrolase [Alphaproteobacteria bacterium]|nr:linear amide C-N hydrolase [Alphaproteobacteria bacterium]